MAGEPEEITMLHYLLYKALAEERARDLVAVARRRQLVAEAIRDSKDGRSRAAHVRAFTVRMVALLNGRRGARPGGTATSTLGGGSRPISASNAGPIGCAT
jgi:hypothetical protein